MRNCECGCGEPIPEAPHHKYRPPRFISGHHVRTAEFLATRAKLTLQPPPGAIPSGLCECGCGGKTRIARQSRPDWGQYKGHPVRYIHGHHPRGKRAHGWKGGRKQNRLGYWFVWMPGHHLAAKSGYVPEHRLVWEQTNNRRLEPDEHVHHIDGNPSNNAPENLVAMTKREHMALHRESPLTRARLSARLRERYKDPAQRAKTAEATRRSWKKRKG